MPLEIVTIPCLTDNYAYLLRDAETGQVALVDAPQDAPIRAALDDLGWSLDQILITHHHSDHIDGVESLRRAFKCSVTGAKADRHRLPKMDVELAEGDIFKVGSTQGQVFEVYGHTIGHIAFFFPAAKALFSADSLMTMGCGRLVEGTAPQMWDSLCKLAALPGDTIVHTGHEYTATNTRFALTVDPDNAALHSRATTVTAMRAAGLATVPSLLSEELATNPFLRAVVPEVKSHIGMPGASDVEAFAELRKRKDGF